MADETARRTPTPAKLLLGLILTMVVIALVWLTYATLFQTTGDPAHDATTADPEHQAEDDSTVLTP